MPNTKVNIAKGIKKPKISTGKKRPKISIGKKMSSKRKGY